MYAGTTFVAMRKFDAWFGAHQKIDRVSRRNLAEMTGNARGFPTYQQIVRFEGRDGPDGIKRKSPAKDEPWHFVDPFDETDLDVAEQIAGHHVRLVTALQTQDTTRAAFEAAWLAHALVDGLTPAHHYPFDEELIKLRGGEGNETRISAKEKVLMPGDTLPKQLKNNWKMWGDKGLLATHLAFEWGVAAIIVPLRLKRSLPTDAERAEILEKGVDKYFLQQARTIAELRMYDDFYRSGWTPRLAKMVRRELAPIIIKTVTLSWYAAVVLAVEKGDN